MAQRLDESKSEKSMRKVKNPSFHKPATEKKVLSPEKQRQLDNELIKAAEIGNDARIKKLLNAGANIEIRSDAGWTPLMHAAYCEQTGVAGYEQIDAVRALIEKGADVNAMDERGGTVFMLAAEKGHTGICVLLLEKGADINAKDEDGWTALMKTAVWGTPKNCAFLLENGVDISAKDKNGWNASMCAIQNLQNRNVETAEFLKFYPIRKMLGKQANRFLSDFRECTGQ